MPVPSDWRLPQAILDRLGERSGSQRAMFADGHLLLILHKAPLPGEPERQGVYFWRDPQGQWLGDKGVGDGLAALRRHLEEYEGRIDALEAEYRQSGGSTDYFDVLRGTTPVHRAATHLLEAMQAAREAVPKDKTLISLRDRAGEIDRAAELLHEDAQDALDYTVARQAEEQSRLSNELTQAGNRLNTIAAIFLPVTAIASVFGMNLTHGLENASPAFFWIVLIAGTALGFGLRSAMMMNLSRFRARADRGAQRRRKISKDAKRVNDRSKSPK